MNLEQLRQLMSSYERELKALQEFQDEVILVTNLYTNNAAKVDPSKKLELEFWMDNGWKDQYFKSDLVEERFFYCCKKLKQFFKEHNDLDSFLNVHLIDMEGFRLKHQGIYGYSSFIDKISYQILAPEMLEVEGY